MERFSTTVCSGGDNARGSNRHGLLGDMDGNNVLQRIAANEKLIGCVGDDRADCGRVDEI
jgi:hypothetical protein